MKKTPKVSGRGEAQLGLSQQTSEDKRRMKPKKEEGRQAREKVANFMKQLPTSASQKIRESSKSLERKFTQNIAWKNKRSETDGSSEVVHDQKKKEIENMFEGSTFDEIEKSSKMMQNKFRSKKQAQQLQQEQQKAKVAEKSEKELQEEIQKKLKEEEQKKIEGMFEGSTFNQIEESSTKIQLAFKQKKAKQQAQQELEERKKKKKTEGSKFEEIEESSKKIQNAFKHKKEIKAKKEKVQKEKIKKEVEQMFQGSTFEQIENSSKIIQEKFKLSKQKKEARKEKKVSKRKQYEDMFKGSAFEDIEQSSIKIQKGFRRQQLLKREAQAREEKRLRDPLDEKANVNLLNYEWLFRADNTPWDRRHVEKSWSLEQGAWAVYSLAEQFELETARINRKKIVDISDEHLVDRSDESHMVQIHKRDQRRTRPVVRQSIIPEQYKQGMLTLESQQDITTGKDGGKSAKKGPAQPKLEKQSSQEIRAGGLKQNEEFNKNLPKVTKVHRGERMLPMSFEKARVFKELTFEKVDEKERKKRKQQQEQQQQVQVQQAAMQVQTEEGIQAAQHQQKDSLGAVIEIALPSYFEQAADSQLKDPNNVQVKQSYLEEMMGLAKPYLQKLFPLMDPFIQGKVMQPLIFPQFLCCEKGEQMMQKLAERVRLVLTDQQSKSQRDQFANMQIEKAQLEVNIAKSKEEGAELERQIAEFQAQETARLEKEAQDLADNLNQAAAQQEGKPENAVADKDMKDEAGGETEEQKQKRVDALELQKQIAAAQKQQDERKGKLAKLNLNLASLENQLFNIVQYATQDDLKVEVDPHQIVLQCICEGIKAEAEHLDKLITESQQALGQTQAQQSNNQNVKQADFIIIYLSSQPRERFMQSLFYVFSLTSFVSSRLNYLLRNSQVNLLNNLFAYYFFFQMSFLSNFATTTQLKKNYWCYDKKEVRFTRQDAFSVLTILEDRQIALEEEEVQRIKAMTQGHEGGGEGEEQEGTTNTNITKETTQQQQSLQKNQISQPQQEEEELGEDGQVIKKEEVNEKLVFYRLATLSNAALKKLSYSVGQSVHFDEFFSCSQTMQNAQGSLSAYNSIFTIEMTKLRQDELQTKDWLANCASILDNVGAYKQMNEVIFPSGASFKIASWKRNEKIVERYHEFVFQCGLNHVESGDKGAKKK